MSAPFAIPARCSTCARLRLRVVAGVCCGGWWCGVWWYVSGVVVAWVVFVGGLGGIATIGAALRRVAGVSVVYGRKTPRVVAHSAVHLGGMRVEWGVWGVVDYGLGVVVGLMGEWWLGFALVAGGMSLVLVWCRSSSLVAWGELLP